MFGTTLYGQTYFGDQQVQQDGSQTGGLYGTATFGSPYFGQYEASGYYPPIPPVPPIPPTPPEGGSGGGSGRRRGLVEQELARMRQLNYERKLAEEVRLRNQRDESELETIIGLWLNLK